MGNVKGPGMGAPNQRNSNPHTVWGAPAHGNPNQYSGWGAPSTGNANQNIGWGAQTQSTDASAGCGTGSNRSWNLPAGDPDSWGAQRKHHGDKYPRGRESGHGGGRISWDGSGEASRPIPRGQGQRGVCKFHESGHCKKGASCNYLHP